jgi:hypothetical protein
LTSFPNCIWERTCPPGFAWLKRSQASHPRGVPKCNLGTRKKRLVGRASMPARRTHRLESLCHRKNIEGGSQAQLGNQEIEKANC